jgi:hypothetical protein
VVSTLYDSRAAAFARADPGLLTEVYAPGSALLDRDVAAVRGLQDAGQVLSGFAPAVLRVESVTATAQRAELRLVDDLPGYRVAPVDRPDAATAEPVRGRGEAVVRIVLERTTAGWRISDARVEP